jgi:predicted RNase H-like nuclease
MEISLILSGHVAVSSGGAASLMTGVDGCKFGWIAITLDTHSWVITHALHPDGVTLVNTHSESSVVAIDIPIGLTEQGARACDQAARALLGRPRSSSVFPAPIRPALAARNREETDRITREADGRGVGAQAWNIYNRVRDMDGLFRSSSRLREKVYNAHPVLRNCFNPPQLARYGLINRLEMLTYAV